MARYSLPDLPYDYDALEPHIDEQTMRLHHDKHHQGYVDGANAALDALESARDSGDYGTVKKLSRDLAFNASGHLLHSVFWPNMAPESETGEPGRRLASQLEDDFGGVEKFKDHFSAAAKGVEGSGWGILAWEPEGEQLLVLQAEKHQNLTAQGVTPILVLDVWEHAYYLNYQNNRGQYVDNWWNVVNWNDVSERLRKARG
ncbi:MAG: superoxide dismutase [Candidatus Palauibacterales bacterium]|nr:superoxide dismutase [Candidatus Palauibacterales bacterium]